MVYRRANGPTIGPAIDPIVVTAVVTSVTPVTSTVDATGGAVDGVATSRGGCLVVTDHAVTGGVVFEPVARRTVSTQIREQLLQRITTGELAPGARIPSERELSDQFQVARTSVREAIQGLLSLGVIERRGNRTCVAEHLPEVSVDRGDRGDRKTFVRELFETRRVLEGPVFALATERADDAAREAVAALMHRFDEGLGLDEFRRLDREFHTTIAAQCGNPLLIELYGKVLDRLFRSRDFDALLRDEQNRPEVRRIVVRAIDGHRRIAAAFASGDAAKMVAAATEHIDAIEHSMVDDLH